jgi:glycosyltransferase involved in cell wall biosynthesis
VSEIKSINYAMFPSPHLNSDWDRTQHPLLSKIAEELAELGCNCVPAPEFVPTIRWLVKNRNYIDLIHLHWPEQIYSPLRKTRWMHYIERIVNCFRVQAPTWIPFLLRFYVFVWLCKLFQIPIVWTLHELYPHGQTLLDHSKRDFTARRHLMQNAAVVIYNCETARALAIQEFGQPRESHVAPLGPYHIWYPNLLTDEKARTEMGVENTETVFLCFGTMRKNRNALELIKAIRKIPDANVHLFIAGRCPEPLRKELEVAAWGDWRIRCFFQVVPNSQVEYLFKTCDFVVMPGVDYLTSAVVMLALSYGRPVIAPRYGCAIDMIGNAGILYDDVSNGLSTAIQQAIQTGKATYQDAAVERAKTFSWHFTASQIHGAYKLALKSVH